jgi:hypothetical protein
MLVLLVPALVVLIPAGRLLPQLYRWRVRSRIYRWYAGLKEIELELDDKRSQEQLDHIIERLDKIEAAVNRIETPLAYSENLYAFRTHIDLCAIRPGGDRAGTDGRTCRRASRYNASGDECGRLRRSSLATGDGSGAKQRTNDGSGPEKPKPGNGPIASGTATPVLREVDDVL